mmetsp:Transcript_14488/g.42222  ORF Transcript_14488/g.42222 Transcript_14488/m.42222 type:complete len:223 (-) Transcript_14488:503-1171(-)
MLARSAAVSGVAAPATAPAAVTATNATAWTYDVLACCGVPAHQLLQLPPVPVPALAPTPPKPAGAASDAGIVVPLNSDSTAASIAAASRTNARAGPAAESSVSPMERRKVSRAGTTHTPAHTAVRTTYGWMCASDCSYARYATSLSCAFRSASICSSSTRMNVMTAVRRCRLRAGLPRVVSVPAALSDSTTSASVGRCGATDRRLSTLDVMSARAKCSTGPM